MATLKDLLAVGVTIGAMRFSVWVMDRVKLPAWTYDIKTYIGVGIAVVVGLALWGLELVFGYVDVPVGDWRQWVEAAVQVALVVVAGSQLWYGALKARRV